MTWLTGWNYRKVVTISNTGSALSDYQVLITVDTTNLVTNLKMRSDCGDIRFTDTDGSTLLPYWVESGCNTISTKIWTKIPSILTGTKTIYMYYGNPGLVSDSNATTVFTIPTTIATGGTITYDTNAYAIHTFTSSGIFTSFFSGDVKVTAWAGGGGGAVGNDCSAGAGGGGSGEAIVNFPLAVSPVAYTITVGNGGASGTPWSGGTCSNGFKGEDTTITIGGTTYVTVEGGYGGLLTATGGKGGGATGGAGGTGWVSPLSGSSGTWSGYRLGGSGGGGTTGGNMNGYSGGGGPNTTNLRYSGGGGAGYYGSGGSAGFNCSGSGTANSGAGGGGANHNGGAGCGVGGSGNVIIRYINRKYTSPEPTFSISVTEELGITATNMTLNTNTCAGPCQITAGVTWQNLGSSSVTFTPAILIDNTIIAYATSNITIGPNPATGSSTITTPTLSIGTHNICPYPN